MAELQHRPRRCDGNGGKDRPVAKLDGAKLAEVVLKRNGLTDEPIVMHDLKYWGAPRNDGFLMMANETTGPTFLRLWQHLGIDGVTCAGSDR
ncbi:MAG TPA: hypothetical protein VFZ65_09670 [Planctomycetota bacterium]|nr:hypothetical protein [Planctomycetota bacterium]